jgi:hypothetical protein
MTFCLEGSPKMNTLARLLSMFYMYSVQCTADIYLYTITCTLCVPVPSVKVNK